MSSNTRIKVIKRDERHARSVQTAHSGEKQGAAENHVAAAKTNAATMVTMWVRELRQRKGEDARRGFKSLFPKAA